MSNYYSQSIRLYSGKTNDLIQAKASELVSKGVPFMIAKRVQPMRTKNTLIGGFAYLLTFSFTNDPALAFAVFSKNIKVNKVLDFSLKVH